MNDEAKKPWGGWKKAWVVGLLLAGVAFAAQTVDQGSPGLRPWPVTITGGSGGGSGGSTIVTGPDGGAVPVTIFIDQGCNSALNAAQEITTTASGIASISGQQWLRVCNTLQNGSSVLIKCNADGNAPVFAATNPGDVLAVGDCVEYHYAQASGIVAQCISNAASGAYVTTFQCAP